MKLLSLDRLLPGQQARVGRISAAPDLRRRLLDLGMTEGTTVRCLFAAPSGDPLAYWVRGAVIALRRADAARIAVAYSL